MKNLFRPAAPDRGFSFSRNRRVAEEIYLVEPEASHSTWASETVRLDASTEISRCKPVHVTSLIFLLVAIPILFCMITWVAATAYRLYFPEKPVPLERELAFVSRAEPTSSELLVPIGVREIKEDERRRRLSESTSYQFTNGMSNGVPSDWLDDVWCRRN